MCETWIGVVIPEIGEERMNLKGRVNKTFGNFWNVKGKTDISLYAKISSLKEVSWEMSFSFRSCSEYR